MHMEEAPAWRREQGGNAGQILTPRTGWSQNHNIPQAWVLQELEENFGKKSLFPVPKHLKSTHLLKIIWIP